MNKDRSVDFLPEIFQTPTNKKVLASTLDQLIQEPKLAPWQGFIGRRAGVDADINFIAEPTSNRRNYQLEPSVVFGSAVDDVMTYPEILDAFKVQRGNVTRHDRLFESEFYTWDPFVDYDKLVNFSQYYWLPGGPDAVVVAATAVPLTRRFEITRTATGYTIEGEAGVNPPITLVRGGQYEFVVNQPPHSFWIQGWPGNGGAPWAANVPVRSVLGVDNNGEDDGVITFAPPSRTAQAFYHNLPTRGSVDLVTTLRFDQINNQRLDFIIADHGGIDGVTALAGKTLVFFPAVEGWERHTPFDISEWDEAEYAAASPINALSERYGVWRVEIDSTSSPGIDFVRLVHQEVINPLTRWDINEGAEWSSRQLYKDVWGEIKVVPFLSASLDILYYSDGTDSNLFGEIRLVESSGQDSIDVNSILGQPQYTSGNGVVFTNGLKVRFEGIVTPAEYQSREFYVEGVGVAIELVPVEELVTPEPYTRSQSIPWDTRPWDSTGYDASLNSPVDQDYIVMNRASQDRNAWARHNRWFHVQVIEATARYNNFVVVMDQSARARRPILEFRSNLGLFDAGRVARRPISVIDHTETDALSHVHGAASYEVDGAALIAGSRVVFAADTDPDVRAQIWTVEMIDPTGTDERVIRLVAMPNDTIEEGHQVVCMSGITQQGKTFYYTSNEWREGQAKTSVNQALFFDVYDRRGRSFADPAAYPASSFTGSKLFGYQIGTGSPDAVLKFALKYRNVGNVGDIEFANFLFTDEFNTVTASGSATVSVGSGVVHCNTGLLDYTELTGWTTASTTLRQRQVFDIVLPTASTVVSLDVPVDLTEQTPVIVFVDGDFAQPNQYTVEIVNALTVISFSAEQPANTVIQVRAYSNTASASAYYEVPLNLERNPFNESPPTLTLGTIRSHYQSIAQHLGGFAGSVNGPNNTRDLGAIGSYGQLIVQHSAPLTFAAAFAREHAELNFFDALQNASQEYEKIKALIVDSVGKSEFTFYSAAEILDEVLDQVNSSKTSSGQFYWTDMVPAGKPAHISTVTVTSLSSCIIDLTAVYEFDQADYRAVLVYLNGVQLLKDTDYIVANDGPRLEIVRSVVPGDVIEVREYTETWGSFVPNTPTKMGLYPASKPAKIIDTTFVTPVEVIRGHDGSIDVCYGDYRDDVLLEFEMRIYNNLKVSTPPPLRLEDIMPGQFRVTEWSHAEMQDIMTPSFLSWLSWNRLEYRSQDYERDTPQTYNYSNATNRLDGSLLLGHWRGIYTSLYDTDRPHEEPWRMLGFHSQPEWWVETYGPAPWTATNAILWDDLEAGLVRDPAGAYTDARYARPGLSAVVPVDSSGALRGPLDVVVDDFEPGSFRRTWALGDLGPVESAWRRSSSWPYTVQRLLALCQPARYFALGADRDSYRYDSMLSQYVVGGRTRISPKTVDIPAPTSAKHSYLTWIVDYGRMLGTTGVDSVEATLRNLDVRLAYRVAGFTDKQYLKVFTEHATPGATGNTSLFPDESYEIRVHKNEPLDKVQYSAVVVQRTTDGYAVYGYGPRVPFFEAYPVMQNGAYNKLTVLDSTILVGKDFYPAATLYPYGHVFKSVQSVAEFILGYGKRLTDLGYTFTQTENGNALDWERMAREFVYWAKQGWPASSLITLNPNAEVLEFRREQTVVDSLARARLTDLILNQNKQPLRPDEVVIDRLPGSFGIRSLTTNTIAYVDLRLTQYEHVIVFDNSSIFGDLIYDPILGARQTRLRVSGFKTVDWAGEFNAPGFIFNLDNVQQWQPGRYYSKGEIVSYKNKLWSAVDRIKPGPEFVFSDWLQSDYNKIKKGLLPNISTKAEQARSFYNNKEANLERDGDLFGFSLIGFKQREYLADIGLDDISQVGLYSEFVFNKGTTATAELFKSAKVGNDITDYKIYENWAIKRAEYGATSNRASFEITLDAARLKSSPAVVSVYDVKPVEEADQHVAFSRLYRHSDSIRDAAVMPTRAPGSVADQSLPSAGFVNFDDVDFYVFDIRDITADHPYVSTVWAGSTLWVAHEGPASWNVYRAKTVDSSVIRVQNNFNGTLTVVFSSEISVRAGQLIVLKNVDPIVNNLYQVQALAGTSAVVVSDRAQLVPATLTTAGVCLVLESMRVASPAEAGRVTGVTSSLDPVTVWASNDGDDHWSVLRRQGSLDPDQAQTLAAKAGPGTGAFGAALTVMDAGECVLSGDPKQNSNRGQLTSFFVTADGFEEQTSLTVTAPAIRGLGTRLAAAEREWAIAGAPTSVTNNGAAVIVRRDPLSRALVAAQILVPPTAAPAIAGECFGASVAMSRDGAWAFVGAPGAVDPLLPETTSSGNRVFVYQQVPYGEQTAQYIVAEGQFAYLYTSTVTVSNPDQLLVYVNGIQQTHNTHWTSFNGAVQLAYNVRRYIETLSGTGSAGGYSFYPSSAEGNIVVSIDGVPVLSANYNVVWDTAAVTALSLVRPEGAEVVGVETHNGVTYYRYVVAERRRGTIEFVGVAPPTPDMAIQVEILNLVQPGDQLVINRKQFASFTASAGVNVINLDELYTATNTESVVVTVDSVMLMPYSEYTVTDGVLTLTATAGQHITVSAGTYYRFAGLLTDTALGFGSAISVSANATLVAVGAAGTEVDLATGAGTVSLFDRWSESHVIQPGQDTVPFDPANGGAVASVRINERVLQGPAAPVPEYEIAGNEIVLLVDSVAVSDIVEVTGTKFRFLERHTAATPSDGARFGSALALCQHSCSLFAGAPGASISGPLVGSVERFVHNGRAYGVVTATLLEGTVLVEGDSIRVNGVEVVLTEPTIAGLAADIQNARVPNVTALAVGSTLVINIINPALAAPGTRLAVLPGCGALYTHLGFQQFDWVQTITPPRREYYGYFGAAIGITANADSVAIAAPNSDAYITTTFDYDTTVFDSRATTYVDQVPHGGTIYSYDYLPSATLSPASPGVFVLGQQIVAPGVASNDNFGTALVFDSNHLFASAPRSTMYKQPVTNNWVTRQEAINAIHQTAPSLIITTDEQLAEFGYSKRVKLGRILGFSAENTRAWHTINRQTDIVDIDKIVSVRLSNTQSNTVIADLDYIDPLRGKVLGAALQNLDFITGVNPAVYSAGTTNVYAREWGADHVGQLWWDTSAVRFIDYNQKSNMYAANQWAQVFPGSQIQVYEWSSSAVKPEDYNGVVWDPASYTEISHTTASRAVETRYYFWVLRPTAVNVNAHKTLSADVIARYIENPTVSGIPYAALINASSVALYNTKPYLTDNSVLQVEFQRTVTNSNVHSEFELVTEGKADSFLSDATYDKFLDSFCGTNTLGHKVPNVWLPESDKYGITIRPRASVFRDRFSALKNYLEFVNSILIQYTIVEDKVFPTLFAAEPLPTAGWDLQVSSSDELSYQNFLLDGVGYRYLVESDSANNGRWAIYTLNADYTPIVTRVQNYATNEYWYYTDWFASDFDSKTKISVEIPNASALASVIGTKHGTVVRVTANNTGRWELYQFTPSNTWQRVGLQNGTIQISNVIWDYAAGGFGFDASVFDFQRWDQEPVIESRFIIQSINSELFTNDLAIYKNQALMLLFDFILSEQAAPGWLMKTSLVDVEHRVRDLGTSAFYQRDLKDFVYNYINEVKPYHVKFREFYLKYNALDLWNGKVTDFDVPAYYSTTHGRFISPVLDDTGTLSEMSSTPNSDGIWQTEPWSDWYTSYSLDVGSIDVINRGSGYFSRPEVTIVGECDEPAVAVARINSAGQVTRIDVVFPGVGYRTTPVVVIAGTGSGVQAVVSLRSPLVRSIKIGLKYDRVEYPKPADDVDADKAIARIREAYAPTANMVGRDIGLLINGTTYPGVTIKSPGYDENAGFDVGAFDTTVFDLQVFGPEGRPTYDPALLDATYESSYLDSYLGTRSTDLVANGAAYLDVYNSHAPEELVPGLMLDTLDIRVYTRAGVDTDSNGHGFPMNTRNATVPAGGATVEFTSQLDHVVAIKLIDNELQRSLVEGVDYTIDWPAGTVAIAGTGVDREVSVVAFGLGGGNHLEQLTASGADFEYGLTVDARVEEIYEIVAFVNGVPMAATWQPGFYPWQSLVYLNSTVGSGDRVTLLVLGYEAPTQYSYSAPVVEQHEYLGSRTFQLTSIVTPVDRINAVVELNGRVLRPADCVQYIADGSTADFDLPVKGDINSLGIVDNEVKVFVNEQELALGADYSVNPIDFSSERYVTLFDPPNDGSRVIVAVTTKAAYTISFNDELVIRDSVLMPLGSTVTVTAWNDSRQQRMLTQVYQGPTIVGITTIHGFDAVVYDPVFSGFDYGVGGFAPANVFESTVELDSARTWVSLNGRYLQHGIDYTVSDSLLTLEGPIIAESDVLVVRTFTGNVVPEPLAFRIFKDMRDQFAVYRITDSTTTTLTAPLTATDSSDEIHVANAELMPEPNLAIGRFGIITINGERITYRERDLVNNVLRGIRRGTAGTGAADHVINSLVIDKSQRNWLSVMTKTGELYDFTSWDSAEYAKDVVYDTTWYSQLTPDASLQNTQTPSARFLRGHG